MFDRSVSSTLVLVALFLVSGCGGDTASPWTDVQEADLNDLQRKLHAKAVVSRDALFAELSKRLMEAMGEGGPTAAIDVCRTAASDLTESVGKETGVRIGRTSFKLRNPANTPPAWAETLVAQRTAETAFRAHPDGRLGVLLPIRLQRPCLSCHGQPDKIPEPVSKVLAEHYPQDEATGFEAGDLRGWFWVELVGP